MTITPEIDIVTETKAADRQLVKNVNAALRAHYIDTSHIRIQLEGSVVRLTGYVANSAIHDAVPDILRDVLRARDLENHLAVGSPPASNIPAA